MEATKEAPAYHDKLTRGLSAMLNSEFATAESLTRQVLQQNQDSMTFDILQSTFMDQMAKTMRTTIQMADPIDRFLIQQFMSFTTGHYGANYQGRRMRRLRKVMELFGIDFTGKRILELGAGIGDIGSVLASLGAEVVGLEGRLANCNTANLRFRNLSGYQVLQWDLEKDFSEFGRFDLVINFGLVEVIERFVDLLDCCIRVSDHIVLETMVCDSLDPDRVFCIDMAGDEYDDWPLAGRSPRPSPAFIERFFQQMGYAIHRHFDADLNDPPHIYDWEHENNNRIGDGLRRFWHFEKGSEPA